MPKKARLYLDTTLWARYGLGRVADHAAVLGFAQPRRGPG
jgi:hypothetical protein